MLFKENLSHYFCCVLQHNCPVGNVDLQGRTALHDAGKKTLYSGASSVFN